MKKNDNKQDGIILTKRRKQRKMKIGLLWKWICHRKEETEGKEEIV